MLFELLDARVADAFILSSVIENYILLESDAEDLKEKYIFPL